MLNIRNEFFVIDSHGLDEISTSRLYGFAIDETGVFENNNYRRHIGALPDCGCYVLVEASDDKITISQDANGCYGLYLFHSTDGYFAVSNSFFRLLDHVKRLYPLTFNRDYAHQLLATDLCSLAYKETCVNEISRVDRRAIVLIDKKTKSYNEEQRELRLGEIPVDTKKGLEILDNWFSKWTHIIYAIQKNVDGFVTNLSGGFDTRMTFPLVLESGIDIRNIQFFSIRDNNPVYQEDFKIASMIAEKFGFELNADTAPQSHVPYVSHLPYTLEESLELAFSTKMTFHKKMYFQPFCRTSKRVQLQGMGGELIRDYWGRYDISTLSRKNSAEFKNLSKPLSEVFKRSLFKTLMRSGMEASTVNNVVFNEKTAPNYIYSETRNRNHFGKAILENYFGGTYIIAPLLDPLLLQLSINGAECSDPNLIVAFIFARYCPNMFDFPFEGGRIISDEAKNYAKKICDKHPFAKMLKNNFDAKGFIIDPDTTAIKAYDAPCTDQQELSMTDIEQYLSEVIMSPECKRLTSECLNEEIYNLAISNIATTGFMNGKAMQGILGLVAAYEDVKFSQMANHHLVKSFFDSLINVRGGDNIYRTKIPLPQESQPIIYSLNVNGDGKLQVSATIEALDNKGDAKKAAIMLARFYDSKGDLCNSEDLPISAMFKCGFCYLTCGAPQTSITRLLSIPAKAVRADICFSRFLNDRRLVLSDVRFAVFTNE